MPLVAPVAQQPVEALENGRTGGGSVTATLVAQAAVEDGSGLSAKFVVQDTAAPAEEALVILAEETLEIPVKQTVDSLVRPLVESVDASGASESRGELIEEARPVSETERATEVETIAAAETLEDQHAEVKAESELDKAVTASDDSASASPVSDAGVSADGPGSESNVTVSEEAMPEPELLSQATSQWEVTAVPELYAAFASWAHQERDSEQASEPEVLSAVNPELASASETPERAPSHLTQDYALTPEPNVLSAGTVPEPAAAPEVQETASALPVLPTVEAAHTAEESEPTSLRHRIQDSERASEPDLPSALAVPEPAAAPQVRETASTLPVLPSAEAAHTAEESDPTSWPHRIQNSELASEPDLPSALAVLEPAAAPEVQEAASALPVPPSAEPAHTGEQQEPASWSHHTQNSELASEPDLPSALSAPEQAVLPEVQETASALPVLPSSEPAHTAEESDPTSSSQGSELACEPEVPVPTAVEPASASEAQESVSAEPAQTAEVPEGASWAHQTEDPELVVETELGSALAAREAAPAPEVYESANAEPAATAEPQEAAPWPHETHDSESGSEPEIPSAYAYTEPAPLPDIQELAVRDAETCGKTSELEAQESASRNQPEQSTVPEPAIQLLTQTDAVTDDLPKTGPSSERASEHASERATVPESAASEVTPEDTGVQSKQSEADAASRQQLALDLMWQDSRPAEPTPTASQSLPVLATQDRSEQEAAAAGDTIAPQPEIDEQEAGERQAAAALLGAIQLQAETLVDAIHAQAEAERTAIGNVVALFSQSGSTSLLAAPAEVVIAPAPPVFEWIRKPRPILRPLPLPENAPRRPAQPQALTLAGPCLSPELRNLTELRGPGRLRKRRVLPGWVASVMGAMLLVLLAVTSLQYLNNQNDAKAATPAGTASVAAASNTGEGLDKSVEISGLRLAKSWTGQQQVRFLIVNHSSHDLSGVTVQVVVRSSDAAPGSTPILVIHAPLRSLGPYQSQEIKTGLDADLPSSALSDWQSLRTDVQVLRGE